MNPLRLLLLCSASFSSACVGRGLVEFSHGTDGGVDAALGDGGTPEMPDAWSTPGLCPTVPFLAGAFQRVYAPTNGRYLNDHTLVRGDDGVWHLYGITFTGRGNPQEERTLLHATATSVLGPWSEQPDILTAVTALDESVLWAPYVFRASSAHWTMFYEGGSNLPVAQQPARELRMATSEDLFTWQRRETQIDVSLRPQGGRDPFVLHTNSGWLLYSVGARQIDSNWANGQILVSRSSDPDDPSSWTAPTVAIEDPVMNYVWGNLESPFVVVNECGYYLFFTRTDVMADSGDYARTLVFFSRDPMTFSWNPITELPAHAAEIVTDERGRQYITSAGWPGYVGESNRGLSIARIGWARPDPVSDQ